jgi:methanogenic corrinoid protein MtbC1
MEHLSAAEEHPPTWLRPGVARALEGQVIPRLLARHGVGAQPPDRALGGRWLAGLCLLDDETGLADAVQGLQCQGVAVEPLQLDWLGPAAAELGRMWDTDQISFSDVTIGLVRLHGVSRRLSRAGPLVVTSGPGPQAPRLLLSPVPGEQHGFGLSLVADAFRRAGWDVAVAGPDASVVQRVAGEVFDLVGLSLGSSLRAPGVPALCADLRRASRRPGLGVLLGGSLFALPGLPVAAAPWGADAVALDAREAVALGSAWMARGAFPGAPPGVQDTIGR